MINPDNLRQYLHKERLLPSVAKAAGMTYAQAYYLLTQDPPAKPGHLTNYAQRMRTFRAAAKKVVTARLRNAQQQHKSIIEQL
jgi:hypothetical protein